MQIIIPMVGKSIRFKKAGFKTPKFLLKINNKFVIEHVIDLFPGEKNFLFICDKKQLSNKKIKLSSILKKKCPTGKIVSINSHNLGPAFSVSKVLNQISNKGPIIINYCDFNCYWNYKNFKKVVKKKKYDGCVVVYKDFHPSTINKSYFAYIKKRGEKVLAIQEKKPFTKNPINEYTSSGTYYFKNKEILENCLDKSFKNNLKTKGEYYISMIYKPMINNSEKVGFYKINFFSQWGTPEDFNEYKNWSEKFSKIQKFKKKKLKGVLVIPAAGKGLRFIEEGYKTHKPLIEISGKPMIVQSMLTHPKHYYSKVIISKKNNSSKSLKKKIKKHFPKVKIFSLNKHTNGQAITCLETLKKENKAIPVTIGSCDTGLIFNEKKFLNLYNKLNTDIIVWAAKNHFESIRNPKQFGWVKTKNKENIDYISVKKPLKNIEDSPIVLGTFTFKKIEYFINSVNEMIKRKALVNNEFYIDTSINDAIKLGYKCKIFLVDDYLPWGTPNELKTFKYWQEYFNLWKNHSYKINNPI